MDIGQVQTAQEAKKNVAYLKALTTLLYQMADDDLVISHRGSEWLGLVPHIEEDVAYSSITQNTMGHALILYEMLEELGEGKADDIAYLRKPEEFRHAVLVERPNGEGLYSENPDYDWAYAVVRNLAYETFKRIRLQAVTRSSYQPLALAAQKMLREQFYHLQHWQVWIKQLAGATEESTNRLNEAINKVWADVDSLFDLGAEEEQMVAYGLIQSAEVTKKAWLNDMKEILQDAGLNWPGDPSPVQNSGRDGTHSEAFEAALAQLSEVYKTDPAASW
ncbi:phenylacetic acid degradation protein [Caldalkalibacillus thermarum]|uniref:1,2-phenylacetyl-CoA epoxidase subunit PaaC n=1 Tax=Caldalkalibacillus thermarum TaxID=296745 RepID=UPI00166A6CC0|nr:1,2-phenylacetyl-CoA epoxidase subunit PaaC [Caldalkalibacillus thermarum]GGK31306.1 phenylacetic acid degradation protein [Caldalkalibacillus thermarum]